MAVRCAKPVLNFLNEQNKRPLSNVGIKHRVNAISELASLQDPKAIGKKFILMPTQETPNETKPKLKFLLI